MHWKRTTGPSGVAVTAGTEMVWKSDTSVERKGWRVCLSGETGVRARARARARLKGIEALLLAPELDAS